MAFSRSRSFLRLFHQYKCSNPRSGNLLLPVSTKLSSSSRADKILNRFHNILETRCFQTVPDNTINLLPKENDMHQDTAMEPVSANVEASADSISKCSTTLDTHDPNSESNSVHFNASSKFETSKRHDMAMLFTCKVCETRSLKTMSKDSYMKGIVIVRCGGCNNLHLIADRLGWFGDPSSVEDFLRDKGEEIRKHSGDSYELTLEDLAGWKGKSQ